MYWIQVGNIVVGATLSLVVGLCVARYGEKRAQRKENKWERFKLYTRIIAYIRIENSGMMLDREDVYRLADITARAQLVASKEMVALFADYSGALAADGDQRETKRSLSVRIGAQARDELSGLTK